MPANEAENTKPTVIILLGVPGSGKGTIAQSLSKIKKLPHISTGDLFYENVKNHTEHGMLAKSYLDKGQLVPDSLVLDILFDRISQPDCAHGYILDGIPRNISQVHELEDYLSDKASVLAVKLAVSDDIVIMRLSGRLLCQKCNHAFHKDLSPPKVAGVCDLCGGELQQRSDDTPEAIKARLKVFHEQTQPLEKYYKDKGMLKEIDASKSTQEILQDIMQIIG